MALCGIWAHLEHLVSIFLMRDIKWAAVLRDYCLGLPPPLYTLGPNLAEELNPISQTPLCSFGLSLPWFLWLCAATPLLMYSACYICSTCVFLCPKQDFVVGIGCLVDRYQRSPVLCVVVFLQVYLLKLICLPWFCSGLTCILIFLLIHIVMLTQMYANIWQKVWILMLLFSCSSACVALPGVSLWSCQSGTCLAGDWGGSSANLEHGA